MGGQPVPLVTAQDLVFPSAVPYLDGMHHSDGYIEIRFGPRWKYISPVRVFIQNFIAIALSDQAKADSLAMATSELLENAVKYGASEDTQCVVRASPSTGVIEASVTNHATPEGVVELEALYKKVTAGDPLEAYISQMRESATRTDGRSQLGLARIRYETGAEMKLDITPELLVTITILVK